VGGRDLYPLKHLISVHGSERYRGLLPIQKGTKMSETTYYMIEQRKRTLVPTVGSKRRCYDGCFHPNDWEEGWTAWSWLNLKMTKEQAEKRLVYWQDLNGYAVKERGPQATTQFRISVDTVYDGTW